MLAPGFPLASCRGNHNYQFNNCQSQKNTFQTGFEIEQWHKLLIGVGCVFQFGAGYCIVLQAIIHSVQPDQSSCWNILRNVVNADISLFDRFLSHMYYLEVVKVCPTELGWPFNRPRQYCRMRRKAKARSPKKQTHRLSVVCRLCDNCCNMLLNIIQSRNRGRPVGTQPKV